MSDNSQNTENQVPDAANEELDTILKSGGVVSGESGHVIHCLTVIGQIEGHYTLGDGQKATKYEHLIPLIVSIDSHGNNLVDNRKKLYEQRKIKVCEEICRQVGFIK